MATTKKKGSEKIQGAESPVINISPDNREETPKQKTSQESEVLELEAEVVDNVTDQISRELAKFGRADQAIAKLKEAYSGMKIDGVGDKEGYKKVRKAWSEVRGYRTGIEKKKKDIKGTYIKIGKAIDGEEERLLELITPLEDELGKTWKAIDEELEAEEKRKEEAEQKRLNDRVTDLMTIGLRMNSGYYQLGDTITIDVATLRTMTDENYSDFRGKCEKKAAEIKAEDDRLKQEKLDEENKLKKEREDLDRQKKELQEQKDQLEKMKKESEDLKKGIRVSRLQGIGMIYDPKHESFTYWNGYNGVTNQAEEVFGLNDEQFDHYLTETSLAIKDKINAWETHKIQEKKELEIRQKKSERIHHLMNNAGLKLDHGDRFYFTNSRGSLEYKKSELLELDDDALMTLADKARIGVENLIQRQEEADKLKKEEEENERQAGLTDTDLWTEMIAHQRGATVAIENIKFKTKKSQARADLFKKELRAVIDKFSA